MSEQHTTKQERWYGREEDGKEQLDSERDIHKAQPAQPASSTEGVKDAASSNNTSSENSKGRKKGIGGIVAIVVIAVVAICFVVVGVEHNNEMSRSNKQSAVSSTNTETPPPSLALSI